MGGRGWMFSGLREGSALVSREEVPTDEADPDPRGRFTSKDAPLTATARAHHLALDEVYSETTPSESSESARHAEIAARGLKYGARGRISSDAWLDELAAAFWHGEEPRVRKKHPDIVPPVEAKKPACMEERRGRARELVWSDVDVEGKAAAGSK